VSYIIDALKVFAPEHVKQYETKTCFKFALMEPSAAAGTSMKNERLMYG
jgi:hypothetical protein